jgi:hypothetical protein
MRNTKLGNIFVTRKLPQEAERHLVHFTRGIILQINNLLPQSLPCTLCLLEAYALSTFSPVFLNAHYTSKSMLSFKVRRKVKQASVSKSNVHFACKLYLQTTEKKMLQLHTLVL